MDRTPASTAVLGDAGEDGGVEGSHLSARLRLACGRLLGDRRAFAGLLGLALERASHEPRHDGDDEADTDAEGDGAGHER